MSRSRVSSGPAFPREVIMSFLRMLAALIPASLVIATQAMAMSVTPTQLEMASTGTASHAQVTVANSSAEPLTGEAVIARLKPKGSKVADQTADEDFLVIPPQALIPPGATQNFRVQWLGEPLLEKSQSFLLYLNQIPVKLPKGKSGVQVVASLGVMVNVAPPRGEPDLKIVSTAVVAGKDGKPHPAITVVNSSNVHGLLPDMRISLSSGGWSDTIPPGTLSSTLGIGLVQPGEQRRFVLPIDLPPGTSSVEASIAYEKKKR